jgi:hypothetical protein
MVNQITYPQVLRKHPVACFGTSSDEFAHLLSSLNFMTFCGGLRSNFSVVARLPCISVIIIIRMELQSIWI